MDELQIKHELWRRAELDFLRHEGQIKTNNLIKNTKDQLQVVLCSRQFGKTYELVSHAIEFCLKNPRAVVKYGAAFQTDLVEFVLPAFHTILQDCPESICPQYKKSGSKWVFNNGATIHLIGLDKNPDKIRGAGLSLIIIDEAGFVSKLRYIFDNVIMPATTHFPDCKIIMGSTPPMTPDHDFVEFIEEARIKGTLSKYTIEENPLITEDNRNRLIEAAGGRWSTTCRREYYCEIVIDETLAIVPEWNSTKYVQEVENPEYFEYLHKYTAQDLSGGARDLHAIISGYYDFPNARLVITHEAVLEPHDVTSEKVSKSVLSTEKEAFPECTPYKRISDNNNLPFLRDMTNMHGCHFTPVTKLPDKHAMVSRLRLFVQSGRLIIHPRCKYLIGSLETGIWKDNRKEFARSKTYGHYDFIDALIYLILSLNDHTNPIPADFGMTGRYRIPNETKYKNEDAANLLKQMFNKK